MFAFILALFDSLVQWFTGLTSNSSSDEDNKNLSQAVSSDDSTSSVTDEHLNDSSTSTTVTLLVPTPIHLISSAQENRIFWQDVSSDDSTSAVSVTPPSANRRVRVERSMQPWYYDRNTLKFSRILPKKTPKEQTLAPPLRASTRSNTVTVLGFLDIVHLDLSQEAFCVRRIVMGCFQ